MEQGPYSVLVEAITQLEHHLDSIGLKGEKITLEVPREQMLDLIADLDPGEYDLDYVKVSGKFRIGKHLIKEL